MMSGLAQLYHYFGVTGMASVVLWVAGLFMFVLYAWSRKKTRRYWQANEKGKTREGVLKPRKKPRKLKKLKGAKPAKGGYLSFDVDREYSSKLGSALKAAAEGKLGKALSSANKLAGDDKTDPAVRAEAEELAGELLGSRRCSVLFS